MNFLSRCSFLSLNLLSRERSTLSLRHNYICQQLYKFTGRRYLVPLSIFDPYILASIKIGNVLYM